MVENLLRFSWGDTEFEATAADEDGAGGGVWDF